MNISRFGKWTRRRFGLAVTALLASATHDSAEAGKKGKRKKKKRCVKSGNTCTPGGKRKCCKGRTCSATLEDPQQTFCCTSTTGQSCTSDADCCNPLACSSATKECVPTY